MATTMMCKRVIFFIILPISWTFSLQLFNLTLTVPLIDPTKNTNSVFIAYVLPSHDDFYIVDVDSICDRSKIRSISTYLCGKPYHPQNNIWFDHRPCQNMDVSLIIHDWFNSVPLFPWLKNAGVHIGVKTPYRYVVIHVEFLSSDVTSVVAQRLLLTDQKPEYTLGVLDMEIDPRQTIINSNDALICRFRYSFAYIFAIEFDSNMKDGTAATYRLRDNQIQLMLRGNLAWPRTFYQLEKPIDLKQDDYILGQCLAQNNTLSMLKSNHEQISCGMSLMYWVKSETDWPGEMCLSDDNVALIKRFPISVDSPSTLNDINPQYPKQTPEQWLNETLFGPLTTSSTPLPQNQFWLSVHDFLYNHLSIILICASGLTIILMITFCLFCRYYETSLKYRRHSQTISIGGECSSLSQWLTRERFKDDHDDQELLRKSSENTDSPDDDNDHITFTRDISFHRQ